MYFRILSGLHSQGRKLYGAVEPDGLLLEGTSGEIVQSANDLAEKHNAPGSVKFERLEDEEGAKLFEEQEGPAAAEAITPE